MTLARDWRPYWQQAAGAPDASLDAALRQVGKTVLGQPVDAGHLDRIVGAVSAALDLHAGDAVIDLGCGNGVISERVAHRVAWVDAIDISPVLVGDARRFRQPFNITYRVGDLADPDALGVPSGDRFYAYEVLQHLGAQDLAAVLSWARTAPTDREILVFAGSIPDAERIDRFYNTPERWARYERLAAEGREQIGTWWTDAQIANVADSCGFAAKRLEQDPRLYTAHYRFDVLFTAYD